MLTALRESEDERVMTVQIDEPLIDTDLVSALASVLDDVEDGGIENLVVQFSGGAGSIAGDFPSWGPEQVRNDIRFFARWDETLARLSRLKAKTFAAYDGRVGGAAVHLGLVTDLRLASAHARLALGNLAEGRFPGMGAYWLPKFVGLGNARKIFLIGEDLPADRASEFGLVDVVDDTVDAAVDATLKATGPVLPEAAYFARRILDDCYRLEQPAAVEQVKAARFKLGMPVAPRESNTEVSAERNRS
jgi:enoyl-CoA hydratase/carnithine racemase